MFQAKALAAAAALLVTAEPCLAADASGNFGPSETRAAGFAGVQVRMALGSKARSRPVARLQLSSIYYGRSESGAFVPVRHPPGLELGAGKAGTPSLYLAGEKTSRIDERLNLGGTTTTLVVVGGIILVLVVIAAANTPPDWN